MTTQVATTTATDQLWDRWPYLSHERRLISFVGSAPMTNASCCWVCLRSSDTSGCGCSRLTMQRT